METSRQPALLVVDRSGILIQDAEEYAGEIGSGKWFRPLETLVQNATQREQIGPTVHGDATGLFRRHVVGCSQDAPSGRKLRDRFRLGHAEVGDLRDARRRNKDVGRLDVSVHDLLRVRDGKRIRDLAKQMHGFSGAEFFGRGKQLRERSPFDVLHNEVARVLQSDHIVDGNDPGMLETRGYLRLPQKAGPHL